MKTCSDAQSDLKSLKAEFAAFRSISRPHTKIPENLRTAVIAAIDAGTELTQLRTALGLTKKQIAGWCRSTQPQSEAHPRILDLLPSPHDLGKPSGLRVSYESGRLLLEFSF